MEEVRAASDAIALAKLKQQIDAIRESVGRYSPPPRETNLPIEVLATNEVANLKALGADEILRNRGFPTLISVKGHLATGIEVKYFSDFSVTDILISIRRIVENVEISTEFSSIIVVLIFPVRELEGGLNFKRKDRLRSFLSGLDLGKTIDMIEIYSFDTDQGLSPWDYIPM